MFGERGALTKASFDRWLLATRCVIVRSFRADQTGSSLLHTSPNEAALSHHSQFANTVRIESSRIAFRNLQANPCLPSHRSLTTLKPVEPSRVQRLPPDLFLLYNLRSG